MVNTAKYRSVVEGLETMNENEETREAFSERELDYAKEFWTIANIVAGFSIVQTMTFASATGTHRGDLAEAIGCQKWSAVAFALFGSMVYVFIIGFCQWTHKKSVASRAVSKHMFVSFRIWNIARLTVAIVMGMIAMIVILSMPRPSVCV
jgi:hypothetical protein